MLLAHATGDGRPARLVHLLARGRPSMSNSRRLPSWPAIIFQRPTRTERKAPRNSLTA